MNCSKCLFLTRKGRRKICRCQDSINYNCQVSYINSCNEFESNEIYAMSEENYAYESVLYHEGMEIRLKSHSHDNLLSFLQKVYKIDRNVLQAMEIIPQYRYKEKFLDFIKHEIPDVYKKLEKEFRKKENMK